MSAIIDWGMIWVAMGRVPGVISVNKYGRNTDVDTTTVPEDLWGAGGPYTGFPVPTAEPLEILSDSADDASAGIGAMTVVVTGLDSDWNVISETVTLNGVTPVPTVQTFRRAHTMRVATSGSNVFNVGNITVRHATTEANVFLNMLPATNQTNNAGFTIPAGYTGYLMDLIGITRGTVNGTADMVMWVREFGGVPRLRRPFSVGTGYEHHDEMAVPLSFPEKTDIMIRCTQTSANNMELACGYDLLLVKN